MCLNFKDFERIMCCASEGGISDVHITAGEPVRWKHADRLSMLREYVPTDKDIFNIFQVIVREELWEKLARECALNCSWEHKGFRYRVHIYRKRGRLSFAIRVLPRKVPYLSDLGQVSTVERYAEVEQGLLLITGATGAGKSTTAAALLENINQNRNLHILTLEDPIEFLYPQAGCLISQRERGEDFEEYGQAVENAMREAPDVIMVSEMRDARTVQAVLNAAVSGHFVVATMHAGGAVEAVERIISMYPADQQGMARSLLASSLVGICSQRILSGVNFTRHCAVESLTANHAVRNVIRSGKYEQLTTIMQSSAAEGMQTMEMGIELLQNGYIGQQQRPMRNIG